MIKPLAGVKVAVLVANGFKEQNFTDMQKYLLEQGAVLRVVSTNQGLVNGWDGQGWGHNYAVDAPINTALGVDYSALVIVGGQRSLDKLKLTAHTRRFIGSFIASNKPMVVMEDAVNLLMNTEQLRGLTVAGDVAMRAEYEDGGATWSEEAFYLDDFALSGAYTDESKSEYFSQMAEMFAQYSEMDEAA